METLAPRKKVVSLFERPPEAQPNELIISSLADGEPFGIAAPRSEWPTQQVASIGSAYAADQDGTS